MFSWEIVISVVAALFVWQAITRLGIMFFSVVIGSPGTRTIILENLQSIETRVRLFYELQTDSSRRATFHKKLDTMVETLQAIEFYLKPRQSL